LAFNQLAPVCVDVFSGLSNNIRDVCVEVVEDSLPNSLDLLFVICDDQITAFGTFITGLQKCSFFFLDLSKCSLVNKISVIGDEGLGLCVVPMRDLILDLIKVVDHKSPV